MIQGRPGKLNQRLLTCKNPLHRASCGAPDHEHRSKIDYLIQHDLNAVQNKIVVSRPFGGWACSEVGKHAKNQIWVKILLSI